MHVRLSFQYAKCIDTVREEMFSGKQRSLGIRQQYLAVENLIKRCPIQRESFHLIGELVRHSCEILLQLNDYVLPFSIQLSEPHLLNSFPIHISPSSLSSSFTGTQIISTNQRYFKMICISEICNKLSYTALLLKNPVNKLIFFELFFCVLKLIFMIDFLQYFHYGKHLQHQAC